MVKSSLKLAAAALAIVGFSLFPAGAQKATTATKQPAQAAKNRPSAPAIKTKLPEKTVTVKEGVGFDGLRVGKSTMADVVKKYGKDYKWIAHKKYSYQLSYPKLGLSFYLCQSDKLKQIFDIEIRAPFEAKTAKGVVLGKSTLDDIYKIYGKSKDGLEYRGVSFFYAGVKGKKTVTVIDIVENTGIRQCGEETPKKTK
jgi:hypothetical protein